MTDSPPASHSPATVADVPLSLNSPAAADTDSPLALQQSISGLSDASSFELLPSPTASMRSVSRASDASFELIEHGQLSPIDLSRHHSFAEPSPRSAPVASPTASNSSAAESQRAEAEHAPMSMEQQLLLSLFAPPPIAHSELYDDDPYDSDDFQEEQELSVYRQRHASQFGGRVTSNSQRTRKIIKAENAAELVKKRAQLAETRACTKQNQPKPAAAVAHIPVRHQTLDLKKTSRRAAPLTLSQDEAIPLHATHTAPLVVIQAEQEESEQRRRSMGERRKEEMALFRELRQKSRAGRTLARRVVSRKRDLAIFEARSEAHWNPFFGSIPEEDSWETRLLPRLQDGVEADTEAAAHSSHDSDQADTSEAHSDTAPDWTHRAHFSYFHFWDVAEQEEEEDAAFDRCFHGDHCDELALQYDTGALLAKVTRVKRGGSGKAPCKQRKLEHGMQQLRREEAQAEQPASLPTAGALLAQALVQPEPADSAPSASVSRQLEVHSEPQTESRSNGRRKSQKGPRSRGAPLDFSVCSPHGGSAPARNKPRSANTFANRVPRQSDSRAQRVHLRDVLRELRNRAEEVAEGRLRLLPATPPHKRAHLTQPPRASKRTQRLLRTFVYGRTTQPAFPFRFSRNDLPQLQSALYDLYRGHLEQLLQHSALGLRVLGARLFDLTPYDDPYLRRCNFWWSGGLGLGQRFLAELLLSLNARSGGRGQPATTELDLRFFLPGSCQFSLDALPARDPRVRTNAARLDYTEAVAARFPEHTAAECAARCQLPLPGAARCWSAGTLRHMRRFDAGPQIVSTLSREEMEAKQPKQGRLLTSADPQLRRLEQRQNRTLVVAAVINADQCEGQPQYAGMEPESRSTPSSRNAVREPRFVLPLVELQFEWEERRPRRMQTEERSELRKYARQLQQIRVEKQTRARKQSLRHPNRTAEWQSADCSDALPHSRFHKDKLRQDGLWMQLAEVADTLQHELEQWQTAPPVPQNKLTTGDNAGVERTDSEHMRALTPKPQLVVQDARRWPALGAPSMHMSRAPYASTEDETGAESEAAPTQLFSSATDADSARDSGADDDSAYFRADRAAALASRYDSSWADTLQRRGRSPKRAAQPSQLVRPDLSGRGFGSMPFQRAWAKNHLVKNLTANKKSKRRSNFTTKPKTQEAMERQRARDCRSHSEVDGV